MSLDQELQLLFSGDTVTVSVSIPDVDDGEKWDTYERSLLNRISSTIKATGPQVIGRVVDIFEHLNPSSIKVWEDYWNKRPELIQEAANKILAMRHKMQQAWDAIDDIDKATAYAKKVIIYDSWKGLRHEETILSHLAKCLGKPYRKSSLQEESRGIDGYIDSDPVSIKPISYKRTHLMEKLEGTVVYYEKKKNKLILSTD